MAALYPRAAEQGNEEVVQVPRPADAIGAALRDVFSREATPAEFVRLLQRIDRPR